MSSKKQDLLDDITKLAGSAIDTAMHSAADAKEQLKHMVHDKVELLCKEHDLVTRQEFEVAQEMIQKARLEQEQLSARLKKLEEIIASGTTKSAKDKK
tara:strand:- start:218 stop:511 length:294 start_codon:yes stop_codon:yes gene_type:complete